MLDSITATGIVATATSWIAEIDTIVLIVIGFVVTLLLANWAVAKFRS